MTTPDASTVLKGSVAEARLALVRIGGMLEMGQADEESVDRALEEIERDVHNRRLLLAGFGSEALKDR